MADNKIFNDISLGASLWWGIFILISFASFVFLMLWSFQNDSIRGIAIAVIFAIMVIAGMLLSNLKVFNLGTWGENSLSFVIGFLIWIFIGGSSRSVLSLTTNNLLASISSELPQFIEFVSNSFLIPIAEEIFWLIGLPFVIIAMMRKFKNPVLSNNWVQIFTASLISSITFAIFHVGQADNIMFLIGAFIFRFLIVTLVFADIILDVFPKLRLLASFGLGAHIANNFADFGVGAGLNQLNINFMPVGFLIYILFTVIFLSAINTIVLLFNGGLKK